ncbi:polysaccharide pyruvyl transferase family protein [Dorea sp. YH-dor228]|uniref:polysaccharide pyruvyl transferase family protein n=1 Tax=Dorea sp. YH-dor228 TaxID=3151120 RepID=UPI003241FF34
MRSINIALFGCELDNPNMGCMALTYSLLSVMEKIGKKNKVMITYNFFVTLNSEEKIVEISNNLDIDIERILCFPEPVLQFNNFYKTLRTIKWGQKTYGSILQLKKCAFAIDLTQGDSFSDIYGKDRFYMWSTVKKAIEKLGVPLVLGPQTYGPFEDEKVKAYAKEIIEHAFLVMTRDKLSLQYVKSFCEKDIILTTDLAFLLPYNKADIKSNKIKIGINPSGLLCKRKNDDSDFSNKLKTNYDEYLMRLIDWIKKQNKYEIHLISHVGNEAIDCLSGIDGAIYHSQCHTPVEAKTLISGMDIFIGARMHATIGALSSGVATIPSAYSRKFTGLFQSIGYNYIVDLCCLSTEQAINLTIQYINDYKRLSKCAVESIKNADMMNCKMEAELEKLLR